MRRLSTILRHTMIRYFITALRFLLLATFFALTTIGADAQKPVYLKLTAEKIEKARAIEQQAIARKDSLLFAEAWYMYGKAYVFAGNYQVAHRYFLNALRIHEPRGNSYELNRLYVRLSEIEHVLGHLPKALYYARMSMAVARQITSDLALARSYGALGEIYETLWASELPANRVRYDSIMMLYRNELFLCQKLRDTLGGAGIDVQIGTLLTKDHNRTAITYLQRAVSIFTDHQKAGVRVDALTQLAVAYLTFNRPKDALQTLNQAERIYAATNTNDYSLRVGLERGYVQYFEQTGQWQRAFDHVQKLNQLERGQILSDRSGAITRLNIEYETEKKESLLRAQTAELITLRLQQRFTFVTSVLLLLTAGLSGVFFRLYRKNQRTSQHNEVLINEQNHRVKNNLQVVSSLLSLQAGRLPEGPARKAIDESRLRIQSMAIVHQQLYDGEQVAAVDLAEFIPELVNGVLTTYGYATLEPQLTISSLTLTADKAVPLGLILNELTTNACKYAFPTIDAPELVIQCQRNNQLIELTLSDNGPGMPQPAKALKNSFGMQLISAQVRQLRGTYQFSPGNGATGLAFLLTFKG